MALPNVHVFIDDEVITADDLNSIAEAVSAVVSSGNIASSSLVWPLVAQGDIDMNGYSINNIAAFLGVYHVNDSFTFQEAVAAVNSAGGGTIVIDPGYTVTVIDDLITASNVSIIGTSGKSLLTISGSVTNYGIRCTGNYFRLTGCQITGGKTAVPCVTVDGTIGAQIVGNNFNTCVGPCMEFGNSGGANQNAVVSENVFAYNSEQGVVLEGINFISIVDNTFKNVDGYNIELAADTGACQEVTITGNSFSGGDEDAIYGGRTLAAASSHGEITITGNTINTSSTSYLAINLGIYLNCVISGNACQDPCQFKFERSVVGDNAFNSTVEINSSTSQYANNNFRGVISRTSGVNNIFTGNHIEQNVEIDATWIDSFVANVCRGTVTITTTTPDVVGLNWGY